ncbi:MAG TPA: hypothetical protein VGN04_14495 [Herbaspirillum sp.]
MENIFSVIDAEKAFKNYGCKHFYMYREDPDLYSKYENLNISKAQEIRWACETYSEWVKRLADDTISPDELWGMHSRATDLVEYINSLVSLRSLFDMSFQILEKVPESDCIMCAENILGRRDVSCKGGVIFQSVNLHEPDLAILFLELAGRFISRYEKRNLERSEQATKRAKIIESMIRPEVTPELTPEAAPPWRQRAANIFSSFFR